MSKHVSAHTYRERLLRELNALRSTARLYVRQLIDSEEGSEDWSTARAYADGLDAAYFKVRAVTLGSLRDLKKGEI